MSSSRLRGAQVGRPPNQTEWVSWKSWNTLALDIVNLPREVNTHDLHDALSKEGTIMSIDIWELRPGDRQTRGRIRFRPPPANSDWIHSPYLINLRSGGTHYLKFQICTTHLENLPSPVRPGVQLPIENELRSTQVDIGVLLNESKVHSMQTFAANAHPRFVVDVKKKCIFIYFKVALRGSISGPEPAFGELTQHDYRLKITFLQLSEVFEQFDKISQQASLLIVLDSSVICHRKVKNIQMTFTEPRSWREEDTWYRQTAVAHNPIFLKSVTTNLKRHGQVIDLGRWNVFKITFAPEQIIEPRLSAGPADPLGLVRDIFQDYNITLKDGNHFTESPDRPVPVWQWIDFSESASTKASALLKDLEDNSYEHLSFAIRYQLEVCLSQGYLSEYTMTRQFIQELKSLGDTRARHLLEFVASEKKKYLDPMKIFKLKYFRGVTGSKIPSYCCHMHTARITPTTIYYSTPTVDISNRVVRQWSDSRKAGRFLRVRFTDEKTEGRINSSIGDSNDEIYTRVKRTLANGITIGDRHYEFLAFGNSQFREHGAYFFAADAGISAATIRAWMGQFSHIRNVAKYAARLGQSFSTTRAFTFSSVQTVTCEEIAHNGCTFSDGVGKISTFLARLLTEEHNIKTSNGEPPSAYQFRLGGSKGMLVISPDPLPQEVHLRPSQQKFEATHNGLEIIRWSQFSLATLNRQLILVLGALGVKDEVFLQKQNVMLNSFQEAMSSDAKATALLQKYIDPNQTTLILSKMVNNGFRITNEPFMNTMLGLWKAWHLKNLKEKAKIVIDSGADLLGCIDETGTLEGHYLSKISAAQTHEEKLAALPEIFVQICREDQDGQYEVIEGLCILARNPSLHPGDVRVVRAVNKPELRHLRDVVVLPQKGDHDVASMCSGGDLDGDDYLVIWDRDLIPERWFTESMDFKSKKAPDLNHEVTVDEVTSFFVTYMKNDCLPRIAHAHMAWADTNRDGVWSEKCFRLAKLHSDAVDYNKTGGHATMTRDLVPKKWPHFMEKRFKRDDAIYHSDKVLGKLYDVVIAPDFVPNLSMPFDSRILDNELIPASNSYMDTARSLKSEWDINMRQVMAQYEINTEFEVWSTFVLRHGFVLKDFKMQEDLGRIVGTMRRGFRQACYDKAGPDNIAFLVLAMYRVTEEQMSTALKAQQEEKERRKNIIDIDLPSTELPLISFPWVFPEVLGDIAMGKVKVPELISGVNSEAQAAGPIGVAPMFDCLQAREMLDDMRRESPASFDLDEDLMSLNFVDEFASKPNRIPTLGEDRDSGVFFAGQSGDEEGGEDGGVHLADQDIAHDRAVEPEADKIENANVNVNVNGNGNANASAGEKEGEREGEGGREQLDMVEQEGDIKASALDALLSMINN
ncbi:unnamed protein product [Penicillium salamii]|uniref:RNA-dependent RNA polymerase n=1 Tax=Penicillium salamii TaxID=1612424 RepID=A0A9W4IEA5_9EURO|nr:unnamed protein product [Penicillium salamii]CAG8253151.1 unnamed protein product [Penicillium salamii]CAG8263406.1 unnamed protein product [Penicillium salamii]CAG8424326.1 unnamed protein product [Penicillium salamii]